MGRTGTPDLLTNFRRDAGNGRRAGDRRDDDDDHDDDFPGHAR
jgi:hypothetical protein